MLLYSQIIINNIYLGRGLEHKCSKSTAVKNLTSLTLEQGMHSAEQVASSIIKEKMNKEQVYSGDLFYLSHCGKPQIIRVGHPENKGDRNQIPQISFETFKQLRINLDLSNRGTRKLISTLNKATGKRVV